jgi:hypothetical protein
MAENVQINITAKTVKAREDWAWRAAKFIDRLPWWLIAVLWVVSLCAAAFVMALALAGCGQGPPESVEDWGTLVEVRVIPKPFMGDTTSQIITTQGTIVIYGYPSVARNGAKVTVTRRPLGFGGTQVEIEGCPRSFNVR